MINYDARLSSHDNKYAIIASTSQPKTCDNRDCDNRNVARKGVVRKIQTTQQEAIEVFELLDSRELSQRDLAEAIGIAENKVSKIRRGERRLTAGEYTKARQWLFERETPFSSADVSPALHVGTSDADEGTPYLYVQVLPSYAGMGGGGVGDGEVEHALMPRSLIEDELRAKPSDLLLVETRGESMAPDFLHGDQILVDRRDCNPVQPGSFVLWDGDGYVVKLVERVPNEQGRYRVFSANARFSSYEVAEEEIRIMGRPVWFGRRL